MIRLLGLLATIIAGATAWPSGAPGSVCDTLVPKHGYAPQDNANSPYSVTVASKTLTSGASLEGTVRGSTTFKGFMIQVNLLLHPLRILNKKKKNKESEPFLFYCCPINVSYSCSERKIFLGPRLFWGAGWLF